MKTTGIIAEYNPFHNGHKYHIEKARELTGADFIAVAMSGSFVQRGEPAIADKYTRARMALLEGADAVFELPVYFSLGSAEYFASGAVKLLESLSAVDSLCFGSECGDIERLQSNAKQALDVDSGFSTRLLENIRQGRSFARARSEALSQGENNLQISEPNDILGCEYCKALARASSGITPVTIKREGAGYHDVSLETETPSASALRKSIMESYRLGMRGAALADKLGSAVPQEALAALSQACYIPLEADDFSQLLWYCLNTSDIDRMVKILDIDEALARRLIRVSAGSSATSGCLSFMEFAAAVKSRQYTMSRIKRSLFHLMLGITSESVRDVLALKQLPYIRLLGMRKTASALLRQVQSNSSSLIITKMADAPARLGESGNQMLSCDILSARLCNRAAFDKLHSCSADEYRMGPVIV